MTTKLGASDKRPGTQVSLLPLPASLLGPGPGLLQHTDGSAQPRAESCLRGADVQRCQTL